MTTSKHKVAAPSFLDEELPGVGLPCEAPATAAAEGAASAPDVAVQELLAFDPRLIPALPLPTTLLCRTRDGGRPVVITTSRAAYEAARAAKTPVFAGGELLAMVLAAENERGTPAECARWCDQKALSPGWRLGAEVAMSGVEPDARAPRWVLGHVLSTLGLDLLAVEVGDSAGAGQEGSGGNHDGAEPDGPKSLPMSTSEGRPGVANAGFSWKALFTKEYLPGDQLGLGEVR